MMVTVTAEERRANRKAILVSKRYGPSFLASNSSLGMDILQPPPLVEAGSDISSLGNESSNSDQTALVSSAVITKKQEKLDEKARRLEARKVRNRLSAEASRKRARDELENLSARCEYLQDQVVALQNKLSVYENVNDGLERSVYTKKSRKEPKAAWRQSDKFKPNPLNTFIEPAVFLVQPPPNFILVTA